MIWPFRSKAIPKPLSDWDLYYQAKMEAIAFGRHRHIQSTRPTPMCRVCLFTGRAWKLMPHRHNQLFLRSESTDIGIGWLMITGRL